jgi:hypothetical protein
VDPRADLDDVEKRKFLTISGLELRPLGRPARSQLLYRLRYRGGGMELTTHLQLVSRSRMVYLYLYSPIRLHGVVLN